MMQATDFGNRDDRADPRRLGWPSVGCVLVEREMSSSPVIVRGVVGQDAAKVAFAQNEDMIETFAPDRADESLGERVLPRAVGRGQHFMDPQALHSVLERVTVDAVAIAEEIERRAVLRERVDELLGGPGGGGMLGDVEVEDTAAVVGEHDQDEKDAEPGAGHGEEIDRDQVGDRRRFGISRETVRSATSRPSLRSSPWIRGAPQSGLAAAIRMTRTLISALTGGRPPVGGAESLVQCSRNRRRCQRRTVSGVTITRGCFHPVQILVSQTQKRRSVVRSRGRAAVLLYTASC